MHPIVSPQIMMFRNEKVSIVAGMRVRHSESSLAAGQLAFAACQARALTFKIKGNELWGETPWRELYLAIASYSIYISVWRLNGANIDSCTTAPYFYWNDFTGP